MKKHFLIASFVLMGLTTINSCKKDSASSTDSDCVNTSLWIKDGHKFSYKNLRVLTPGDSVYLEIKEISPNVFQSINKAFLSPPSAYLQPCGNIVYESTVPNMANKQISFKLDGEIGESWAVSAPSVQGYSTTSTTTIIEKNVMLTVPAGTFSCMKFRTVIVNSYPSIPTISSDSYYTNKYGLIKIIGFYAHYELAKANY